MAMTCSCNDPVTVAHDYKIVILFNNNNKNTNIYSTAWTRYSIAVGGHTYDIVCKQVCVKRDEPEKPIGGILLQLKRGMLISKNS